MKQQANEIVDIQYEQTGLSSEVDELGMREMQAKAYAARDKRFLLIKAPPASGKSRALMFIALEKLAHQGLKRVVVAVPEKSIGRSFRNTRLKSHGFFADWIVTPHYNLTDVKNDILTDRYLSSVVFLGPKWLDMKKIQGSVKTGENAKWKMFEQVADEIDSFHC